MVTYSILVLLGLGIVAGTLLALASRVFFVEEDPLVEAVLDSLPNANCGGCGYAGCEGYAIAVVKNPSVPANLCVAGSVNTTIQVAQLTGKVVTESDPLISVRRCEKIEGKVQARFNYHGLPSCAAAATLGSGLGIDACAYSCLGLGDCVKVCPFDALTTDGMVVHINASRCTGCGKCVSACPRNILQLMLARARVMIFCSTKSKAKEVNEVCQVGCISCAACVRKCPAKAIRLEDKLIQIDHQACLNYGLECEEICVSSCPRKILRSLCSNICKKELKEINPLPSTPDKSEENHE